MNGSNQFRWYELHYQDIPWFPIANWIPLLGPNQYNGSNGKTTHYWITTRTCRRLSWIQPWKLSYDDDDDADAIVVLLEVIISHKHDWHWKLTFYNRIFYLTMVGLCSRSHGWLVDWLVYGIWDHLTYVSNIKLIQNNNNKIQNQGDKLTVTNFSSMMVSFCELPGFSSGSILLRLGTHTGIMKPH